MISLDTISIRNFLSVGAVTQSLALNAFPLTLILGSNQDVGGEHSRNGAGKTTILQAICYALYGEPLTKIKVDNLVNSINQTAMQVSLAFRRDGVPYRIERGRKPNSLRFLVGSEQIDVAKGKNEQTQIDIERIIGMSHTMFINIVALNTFSLPFLKMKPAEQREIIEELMGITQISQLAEQLKLTMDVNKDILRTEEATVKANHEANARITAVVAQATVEAAHWHAAHERLLTDMGIQATKLLAIDIAAELAVFDQIDEWDKQQQRQREQRTRLQATAETMRDDLRRLQRDVTRYDSAIAEDDSAEILRLRREVLRVRELREQPISMQVQRLLVQAARQRQTAAMQAEQGHALRAEAAAMAQQDSHQCSLCGQGLHGTQHLAAVVLAHEQKCQELRAHTERAMADSARSEQDAIASEAEAAMLQESDAVQRQRFDEQIAALDANIIVVEQSNAAQRSDASVQAQQLRCQISERRAELDATLQQLHADDDAQPACPRSSWPSRASLYAVRQEREKLFARLEVEMDKANPLQEKIDGLTATLLDINYTTLEQVSLQLKHEQFLHKLLTSKDSFIRKRIIDQNLSYLNRCMNKYLERLGLPHEVRFLPDLSVDITLSGRNFDFEQLSRGEMNRVILATSWSFRDTWESLNTNINLMFADEVLDQGTDEAGVEAAVEVLVCMAIEQRKNIFLISHRETLRTRIDHVLVARKIDQFTSFGAEVD